MSDGPDITPVGYITEPALASLLNFMDRKAREEGDLDLQIMVVQLQLLSEIRDLLRGRTPRVDRQPAPN